MKTINLSVPEETWRLARIEAAKRNTSLSGLVRRYLEAMVQGRAPIWEDEPSGDLDRSQRETLVHALQESGLVLGFHPTRENTYER